ncbi:fimbria/pilus outer membrane usher protein [Salmonella enterica subsp. enterica]|nr:fimbria/pilus outer membrane usher protein [Salmonella enterica subsp. enterica]
MRQLRRLTAAIVSRLIYTNWRRRYFQGAGGLVWGREFSQPTVGNVCRDAHAPGTEGAYVNGQKYRTTNRNGVVVYDGLTPYRENRDAGCLQH